MSTVHLPPTQVAQVTKHGKISLMTKTIFAIPSLGRSLGISDQTLKTLKNLDVPESSIYVFVVEEEEHLYKENVPTDINVVVGELGVGNQRTFINNYFETGTRCVIMDDDVQIIVKSENKVRVLEEPLLPLIDKAFQLCDEVGAKMWGVCNTTNGFFMNHSSVFGLRMPYGAFSGEYAQDPDTQSRLPHSEDMEKGIKHYLKYGGYVRFNDVGVKQTRYADGGVNQVCGGKEKRMEVYKECSDYMIKTYPDLVKPSGKEDPSKGLTKIKLKTVSRHPSILSL